MRSLTAIKQMHNIVLLPISDYEERLVGRRLVSSISFVTSDGVKVFYNQSKPSQVIYRDTDSSLTPSPLERLPAELRLQILELIFEDVKPDHWLSAHHHAGATPASVIFASKQLYLEGREMALKACTFDYGDLPSFHRLKAYDCGIYADEEVERWANDPKDVDKGTIDVVGRLNAFFNSKHACEQVCYG
ncbi:MAG: hypothetical protein Q9215_004071 [Flavoplaca cf. flavocitrina]